MLKRARRLRCPVCGEGEPFPDGLKIAERCDVCAFGFEREPGYFLGAMVINYGVIGVIALALLGVMAVGLRWSLWVIVPALMVFGLVGVPAFYRYSRGIWLAMDLAADPAEAKDFR